MAAQALYQIEMTGADPETVLRERLDERLKDGGQDLKAADVDRALFAKLVRGAAAQRGELDDMLSAVLAEEWPVERLETLLRAVLRAGTYELAEHRETPARVIISQYLDVTDAFFGGKEPGLVNGILDRIGHALRPEEFTAPPASGGGGPR